MANVNAIFIVTFLHGRDGDIKDHSLMLRNGDYLYAARTFEFVNPDDVLSLYKMLKAYDTPLGVDFRKTCEWDSVSVHYLDSHFKAGVVKITKVRRI